MYRVTVAGKDYAVEVDDVGAKTVNGRDMSALRTLESGSHRFAVHSNGAAVHLAAVRSGSGYEVISGGITLQVSVQNEQTRGRGRGPGAAEQRHSAEVLAPMPALVKTVNVAAGETISKGQTIVVLEAMKMENDVRAARDGTVKTVAVAPGATVEKGQLLLTLE